MIRKSMPSGYDPMGGNRFSEKIMLQGRKPMTEVADPLVLDFVEWVAREPRVYAEVVATWRTSCPRLTIWEDAADRGYVARETVAGFGLIVTVTEGGKKLLHEHDRVC
jgi:hypothetical protein